MADLNSTPAHITAAAAQSVSLSAHGTAQGTARAPSATPPPSHTAAMSSAPSITTLAQAKDAYERLAEQPVLQSATFLHQDLVDVTLSYKDHATLSKHTRSLVLPLLPSGAPLTHIPLHPVPLDPSLKLRIPVRAAQPSQDAGDFYAHLREHAPKDGSARRFVEVWKAQQLVHSIEVTDAHGAFATDETFASASARVDGHGGINVLYTASRPRKNDEPNPLLRFKYLSPMGEKYAKGFQPALYLLRVGRTREPQLLHIQPSASDRVLGQGVLLNDSQIAATAYDAVPGGRRLGQVYCTNRPSSVQLLTLPRDSHLSPVASGAPVRGSVKEAVDCTPRAQRLSSEGRSARSPRLAPAAAHTGSSGPWELIWLETTSGGAHNSSSAVARASGSEEEEPTIGEIVSLAHQDALDVNSGIYLDQLPKDPFLEVQGKGTCFGLTTISGSKRVANIFQLATGQRIHTITDGRLKSLAPGQGVQTTELSSASSKGAHAASYSFVAAKGHSFIVQTSHPGHPPSLLLFRPQEGQAGPFYHTLYQGTLPTSPLFSSVTDAETTILSIPGTKQKQHPEDVDIEAIYIRPGSASPGHTPPCILFPHGGPHSTSTTDYSPGVAALLAAGYSILFPNYHGSLGRSPAFVESLLGRCGKLDIDDCVATIQYAIERGLADQSHVFLQGGSHGGFISAHLAARQDVRQLWKAIAMRNPVTHIGEMWSTTDIRDWCMAECGHRYPMATSEHDPNGPPTHLAPDLYKSLHDASPLPLAGNVVAPMLLLLGESDQRVPPTQGLAEYHALRALSEVPAGRDSTNRPEKRLVECCWFTGEGTDHALDGVEASRGAWLAAWMWYEEQGKGRRVELE